MGLFGSSTVASLDVEVKSKGVKQATSDLDKLSSSSEKADRRTKSLRKGLTRFTAITGSVGGLAAALAALSVASGVLKNTAEQQRVTAQLEATLTSTAHAAGLSKNQLLEMASALQEVTTYGDEAIIGAENLLLTFAQIGGEVFPNALQATLNVATAMRVDLKSAAIQVGKALNNPIQGISALSDAGVNFSDSQKAVIKELVETGRVADAQRLILIELETEFGNSARAARQTLGGALKGLQNAFGDLLEGDEESGGVEGVQEGIEDLTALLSNASTKQAFAGIANAALTVANGMVKATVAVGNFFGAIKFSRGEEISKEILDIDKSVSTLFDKIQAVKKSSLPDIFLTSETDLKDAIRQLQDRRKELVIERAKLGEEFEPKAVDLVTEAPLNLPDIDVIAARKKKKKKDTSIDRAARDFKKLLDDQKKSAVDFRRELESLDAELDGPLAQATVQYNRELQDLTKEGIKGKVTAEELTQAHDLLTQQFEAEKSQIEEALNPSRQLIDQLKFEVSLIGLSNAERQKAISLRSLEVEATAEQANEIGKLIEQIEASKDDGKDAFKELTNAVEGFGRQATDTFVDFAFGAKASFGDLVNSILKDIARLAIKKGVVNPVVDAFTSSFDGGGKGNLFSEFFSNIFGGNRANTGPASPGKLYRVNETGDEFFQPSVPGNIRNKEPSSGDVSVTVNISNDGTSTSEGNAFEFAKGVEGMMTEFVLKNKRPGGLLA